LLVEIDDPKVSYFSSFLCDRNSANDQRRTPLLLVLIFFSFMKTSAFHNLRLFDSLNSFGLLPFGARHFDGGGNRIILAELVSY
jgi:hypothetical protein